MEIKPQADSPQTQGMVKELERKKAQGTYRVNVEIDGKIILIDVFPGIFPPAADHSVSSRTLYEALGDLSGLDVADIGCGTGVESIAAVIKGAKHVDAVDLIPEAVACSKHNVQLNGLEDTISVFVSDLFSAMGNKKYDRIIANLPITNAVPTEKTSITAALYDPGMVLHRRLFEEARDHINPGGYILLTHSNLQSANTKDPNADFVVLENLVSDCGCEVVGRRYNNALGYTWVCYSIRPKR